MANKANYDQTKINRVVTQGRGQGRTNEEIAQALVKKGFTTQRGTAISARWLSTNFAGNSGSVAQKRAGGGVNGVQTHACPATVMALLTSNKVSDAERISGIRDFYGL